MGIDTETGGLDPAVHALLSVGLFDVQRRRMEEILVKPWGGLVVEEAAARVNGYDAEVWEERGAMEEPVAMVRLLEVVNEWRLRAGTEVKLPGGGVRMELPWVEAVAHQAGFDAGFIRAAMGRHGLLDLWEEMVPRRWRCSQAAFTALMDAGLWPAGSAGLSALMEASGQGRQAGVHRAGMDAMACANGYEWVLGRMISRGGQCPPAGNEGAHLAVEAAPMNYSLLEGPDVLSGARGGILRNDNGSDEGEARTEGRDGIADHGLEPDARGERRAWPR